MANPDRPLVSVVVLTFNHEPYLGQALDGILAQETEFEIEVLVGEDCSTDGTRSVAEEYQRNHPDIVRLITGPTNVGAVANQARCIEQARGEFLAYCEGDDWWLDPHKLAKQVGLMTPDVGIVHADLTRANFDPVGGWTLEPDSFHHGKDPASLRGDLFTATLREAPIQTCTSVYRRSIVEGYLATPLGAPHHLLADLPRAAFGAAGWKVAYLDEVVAVWRRTPRSATRGTLAKRIALTRDVITIYDELEELFGHRTDFDRGAVGRAYQWLVDFGFRGQDLAAFREGIDGLRRVRPEALRSWRNVVRRGVARIRPLHGALARFLVWRNMSDRAMAAEDTGP